jgi:hypothetical protein
VPACAYPQRDVDRDYLMRENGIFVMRFSNWEVNVDQWKWVALHPVAGMTHFHLASLFVVPHLRTQAGIRKVSG